MTHRAHKNMSIFRPFVSPRPLFGFHVLYSVITMIFCPPSINLFAAQLRSTKNDAFSGHPPDSVINGSSSNRKTIQNTLAQTVPPTPKSRPAPSSKATRRTLLRVVSNAPKAQVMIDGILAGRVQELINVEPGRIEIEVTAPGFLTRKASVPVTKDAENTVTLHLEKIKTKAAVSTAPTPAKKPPTVATGKKTLQRRSTREDDLFAPSPDEFYEASGRTPPAKKETPSRADRGIDPAAAFEEEARRVAAPTPSPSPGGPRVSQPIQLPVRQAQVPLSSGPGLISTTPVTVPQQPISIQPPVSYTPPILYQPPVYLSPVYQQPVYQQPVYQQPLYPSPIYQQPIYQQPIYQQQFPSQPATAAPEDNPPPESLSKPPPSPPPPDPYSSGPPVDPGPPARTLKRGNSSNDSSSFATYVPCGIGQFTQNRTFVGAIFGGGCIGAFGYSFYLYNEMGSAQSNYKSWIRECRTPEAQNDENKRYCVGELTKQKKQIRELEGQQSMALMAGLAVGVVSVIEAALWEPSRKASGGSKKRRNRRRQYKGFSLETPSLQTLPREMNPQMVFLSLAFGGYNQDSNRYFFGPQITLMAPF